MRRQSTLTLLIAGPAASFDQLYLTEVLDAHRHARALHAGYAGTRRSDDDRSASAPIADAADEVLNDGARDARRPCAHHPG